MSAHAERATPFPARAAAASAARERDVVHPDPLIVRLFDELRAPLHRYLVCLGVRAAEAEELTQETFLRLHQHLDAGKPLDNPRGWIYRVAHNLALNRRRTRGRFESMTPTEWDALVAAQRDPALGPEELVLERERMTRFHAAFATLTDDEQYSVHLRAEGFRYRQIAEILEMPLSTVVDTLRRAINKLTKACDSPRTSD